MHMHMTMPPTFLYATRSGKMTVQHAYATNFSCGCPALNRSNQTQVDMACPEQTPKSGWNPTEACFKVGQGHSLQAFRVCQGHTPIHHHAFFRHQHPTKKSYWSPLSSWFKDTLYRLPCFWWSPLSSLPRTTSLPAAMLIFRISNALNQSMAICQKHLHIPYNPTQAHFRVCQGHLPTSRHAWNTQNKKCMKVLQGWNDLRRLPSHSTHSISLLTVGKPVCLVLLCLISARRDKVCPQYRARNWGNTNPHTSQGNPFGHVEDICTTSPHFFRSQLTEFWLSYSAFTDSLTFTYLLMLLLILMLCYNTYGTCFSCGLGSEQIWKNHNKCWKNRLVEWLGLCRCICIWLCHQLFLWD